MKVHKDNGYFIQLVDNTLDVLEALSETDQNVHVTRLSERLGMNKSKVFRLLATFQRRGYVEQEQGSHSYRLGLSAFETSQRCLSRMKLLGKARPVMEELVRKCDEAAYLVVRRANEVLFLDLVDTTQQVKVVTLTGRRFPLITTAAGKVFQAFGESTTGPGGSARELAEIKRLGYCLQENDIAPGITSLAAPLFNSGNEVIGALTLLGPDFRLRSDRVSVEVRGALLDAAQTISSRLGTLSNYRHAQGA